MKNNKVVIAYSIVSPLHLINFLSYLDSSQLTYQDVYLLTSNYWGETTLPKRYLDYCVSRGFKLIKDTKLQQQMLARLFASDYDLTLVFVKGPSLKVLIPGLFSKRVEKIAIIDEGISSYASYTHSLKATFREKNGLQACKSLMQKLAYFPIQLSIKKKLIIFTAFNKKSSSINKVYKKNFISTIKNIQSFSSNIVQNYNDSFLFCSQPWIEIGLMTSEEYYNLLHELQNKVKGLGKDLIIKKHPADKVFNYTGFKTLDFDGAVEELVFTCNFFGIISVSSTSSILISACLGYSSYLLDFQEIKSFDKNLQKLFTEHCIDFSLV